DLTGIDSLNLSAADLGLTPTSGLSVMRTQVCSAVFVLRDLGSIGMIGRLNYRSLPRSTVIEPAGSVYIPSGVAADVMFLFSLGLLAYCTRATDPTKGWPTCLASSMTRCTGWAALKSWLISIS